MPCIELTAACSYLPPVLVWSTLTNLSGVITRSGKGTGEGGSGLGVLRRSLPIFPPHPLRELLVTKTYVRSKLSAKQEFDLDVMLLNGNYIM